MRTLEPSLGTVVGAAWSHKFALIGSIIVGLCLFIGAYLLLTPVYEASALLITLQDNERSVDGKNRPGEAVSSLARIAESDEVIRTALQQIGLKRMQAAPAATQGWGLGARLRALLSKKNTAEAPTFTDLDFAALQIGKAVSVRTEPNSEVIRLSFRHADPAVAADFTNALAQSFIDRQIDLLHKPGAAAFFEMQARQFGAEVEKKSREFSAFAKRESTFSVDDQRVLLLKRSSELATSLSTTRSTLADKQGQQEALVLQLKQLKPVTQSPFVSSLVDSLDSSDRSDRRVGQRSDDRLQNISDPPLLLVKVYQDSLVALFRVHAEVIGLQRLLNQQLLEVGTVNREMSALSERQVEFEKLKRELALATFNAELFAKRTVEEQIGTELGAAKLSNLRIIQPATVPLRAIFPSGPSFVALGIVFGLILGVALALLLELFRPEELNNSTQPDTKLDARASEHRTNSESFSVPLKVGNSQIG